MASKTNTTPQTETPAKRGRKRIVVETRTRRGVQEAKCRYCGQFHPTIKEHWFARKVEDEVEGGFYLSGRCRSCESTYRTQKREELNKGERTVKPRKPETEAPASAAKTATATPAKKATGKPAEKAAPKKATPARKPAAKATTRKRS